MENGVYPSGTAGDKMIAAFPRVQLGETVKDVAKIVMENAETFETLHYVYLVDGNDVLRGVMSIKEVFVISDRDVKVEEAMRRDPVVANPLTDQERVVYEALSHNLEAIPVVDKEGELLGIVPYDTILFKFGGIFHKVGNIRQLGLRHR